MDRADKIIYGLGVVAIWLLALLAIVILYEGVYVWLISTFKDPTWDKWSIYGFKYAMRGKGTSALSLVGAAVVFHLLWRWIHKRKPSDQYKRRIKVFWFLVIYITLIWSMFLALAYAAGGSAGFEFVISVLWSAGLVYVAIGHLVLYWLYRAQPKYFRVVWVTAIAIWPVLSFFAGVYALNFGTFFGLYTSPCAPYLCI